MPINRRTLTYLVALLIGCSAVLDTVVALKMFGTTDERKHSIYGLHILHFQPDRLGLTAGFYFDSQMPISALNAIPHVIGLYLEKHNVLPHLSWVLNDPRTARFPTILATLTLTLMVCLWAYDLYGAESALASCILCILSPSLIAHGTLITTDMYHALGVVGSLFFFRRFLFQPTLRNALLSGLTLALAQITKPFALVLYAVVFVVLALGSFGPTRLPSLTRRHIVVYMAIAAASFIAVINFAYSFDRTFLRLGSYSFQTKFFTQLQETPLLGQLPIPVPYPFLQGLDMMKYGEETGTKLGNIYLLGELGDSHSRTFTGFKSYYAVAFFFKEPIALQILFWWSIVWICRNRSLTDFIFGEGLLLAAAAILVFWFSFFSRAQIGIRHILPALAIEVIIAGAVFSNFSSMYWAKKAVLSTLVLWMAVSVASYYPHMIPYMNEWVLDRRLSYRILADSNLDWGQDAYVVDEFLKKNPDVVLNPPGPVAGRILVSANRLTGIERGVPCAVFLARHYKPVAQVGYAHFLFVVPEKDIPSLKAEPLPPHDFGNQ